MFNLKFCSWLDLSRWLLVLEATALPTEPQPLPNPKWISKQGKFLNDFHKLRVSCRSKGEPSCKYLLASSVTRSGDLLDFGQLLNAFGNTLFAQISHILKEFL